MQKRITIVTAAIVIAIIALLLMQYLWNDKMFRMEKKLITAHASWLLQEILAFDLQYAFINRYDELEKAGLVLSGEGYGGNFEKKTVTVRKVYPEPDTIVRQCKTEEEWYTYSKDVHCRYHLTGLNLSRLDSSFKAQLEMNGITLPYLLILKDSSNTILEKIPRDAGFNRFNMELEPIPLGIDDKDFLIARFDGSYYGMFRQMRTILFVSFGMVVILIFTLIYTGLTVYIQKKANEGIKANQKNIAHNLKNQTDYFSQALSTIDVNESQQQYILAMKQKNEWMSLLIEKLLKTSMNKKLIDIDMKHVDLNKFINKIVMQFMMEHKAYKFHFDYDNATPVTACIDTTHFRYALINLIENAIKYANHNPDIYVDCRMKENKIYITVKDNGIGIHPSQLEKIFEPDYRIQESDTVSQKGFGLGLNYVKIVAMAHGGEIKVASEYRKGSAFTLIIPAKKN